jgi:hypothetical protein
LNGAGVVGVDVDVEKVGVSDEEIVDVVSVVVAGVSVDVKSLFKELQYNNISVLYLLRLSHAFLFLYISILP